MTKSIQSITVAGLRFYSYWKHPEDLTGKTVEVIPEPDNPYDKWAIKLMIDGKQLGHVPKVQTEIVHAELDRFRKVYGIVRNHYPKAVVVELFAHSTPAQDLEEARSNPLSGEQTIFDDLENEGLPGDHSEYGDQ